MEGTYTLSRDVLYRDLIGQLVEAHPILFKGRRPRSKSALSAGWYPIVDRLCSDIEVIMLAESVDLDVFEIKEKLGGLRFYHGDDDSDGEKISSLVRQAHRESCSTCMDCGGRVEYTKVLMERRSCDDCRQKRTAPDPAGAG